MTNVYSKLKRKHEKEFNEFPMMFAFSDKQFEEGMEKLGLTKEDTDKIYSIGGGGYIKKTDSKALSELMKKNELEMKNAIDSDLTGEGFIFDMFNYELGNHEYVITYDISDTLDALDLTYEEVKESEKLSYGLKLAKKAQMEYFNEN